VIRMPEFCSWNDEQLLCFNFSLHA
jgi:hypothetical protein